MAEDSFKGFSYGNIDINPTTGRITQSYENMMGKEQPSHVGSQSQPPVKQDIP